MRTAPSAASSSSPPSSRSVGASPAAPWAAARPNAPPPRYFSDVGDLAGGAQVQLADVPVGSVSNIALDGSRAKVTLTFDNNVRIPADVSAAIARTTILGDQFVQLNVPKSQIGAGAAAAPQLADGAVIKKTSTAADVEQFVAGRGASVFGAISTTELEQIIEAGGQGFTGQAASLKAFLEDLDTVATTYSQHTSEITSRRQRPQHPLVDARADQRHHVDRARQPEQDRPDPGAELAAVRDAAAVARQPVDAGPQPPREVLPPDRHAAADAAGGQQPAGPAPVRPGRPPLRDPRRQRRPAQRRAQRLRAALREHHRLRHPGPRVEQRAPAFSCAPTRRLGRFGLVITRRLIINLIAFFAVSFALVGYGIVNLLGNPLSSPTMLTTEFPNASGLYAGFEVELNGVPVGTVSSTALTKTPPRSR